jgi:hypothetical protein
MFTVPLPSSELLHSSSRASWPCRGCWGDLPRSAAEDFRNERSRQMCSRMGQNAIRRLVASSTNTVTCRQLHDPRTSDALSRRSGPAHQYARGDAELLDALALSAGYPDPCLPHPTAQRLPRNFEIMTLCQLLGRECRSKVRVALPHQGDRMIANHIRQAVVRGTTAAPAEAPPSRYLLNSRYA